MLSHKSSDIHTTALGTKESNSSNTEEKEMTLDRPHGFLLFVWLIVQVKGLVLHVNLYNKLTVN